MITTPSIDALRAAGLSDREARAMAERLDALARDADPAQAWRTVSRDVLAPEHPHAMHRLLYDAVFASWDASKGPRPAWSPTREEAEGTNIAAACRRLGYSGYDEMYRWSVERRVDFWRDAIERFRIPFHTPPRDRADLSAGVEAPAWLPGARLNIAQSCFVASPDATAVVFQREGGRLESVSYGEIDRLSNRVANSLRDLGLSCGDAVAIAMPMTLEAVAAYLGIVKAGCIVVSIADSFAPDEIRTRLRIAGAEVAVTQDVLVRSGKTLPMYEKIVAAGARAAVVVPHDRKPVVKLRDADRSWEVFLSRSDRFEPAAAAPEDATNILFSSGTTGEPKAIPWSHTTPIKCIMDGHYHHDIRPGEVVAWPTNIGWMMGPWLIYASLANGATIGLYYGAPNTREFCEFVQNARVRMLGVVPSLVKAWRNGGMIDGLGWSGLRAFSSTGEASNTDDYLWLMARARYRPVIEYCGGTEIGGGYITQTLVQPASPATFSTPSLGLDFHILDEEGKETTHGELFLVPPSIGLSLSLLNRDHHEVYHEGTPRGPKGELLRRHGDQMERLPGGYFRAHGRADDTMNLGGIKVSSAEIERVVVTVDGITDAAAVAVNPEGGGPSLLVVYVVPGPGARIDATTSKRAIQEAISSRLNPLFHVHDVRVVDSLPRTASNKVMRRVLRDGYRGEP